MRRLATFGELPIASSKEYIGLFTSALNKKSGQPIGMTASLNS
jgi:hypothetical protein